MDAPSSAAPAGSDLKLLVRFLARAAMKTAVVLAIPLVATVAYVVCLNRVGELLSPKTFAALSVLPQRILWLTGYYDTGHLHKTDIARIVAPDVVVIGTSRAMQIRGGFFDKLAPNRFYNAAGCCPTVFEAKRAVDALIAGEKKPKVIIFGVEPWWFQTRNPKPSRLRTMFGPIGYSLALRRNAATQWMSGLVDRVQVLQLAWRDPRFQHAAAQHFPAMRDTSVNAELIGVSARVSGNGFRNDGSYRYSELIETQETISRDSLEAFQRAKAFDRATIEDILRRPNWGGRFFTSDSLRTFESIVDDVRAAGIKLIVYVAPVAPAGLKYFDQYPGENDYLHRFHEAMAATCVRNGVPMFDAYDGRMVNAVDDDFIDWLHPSERLMARLMMQVYADPGASEILRPFGDGSHLTAELAASHRRWQVYDY